MLMWKVTLLGLCWTVWLGRWGTQNALDSIMWTLMIQTELGHQRSQLHFTGELFYLIWTGMIEILSHINYFVKEHLLYHMLGIFKLRGKVRVLAFKTVLGNYKEHKKCGRHADGQTEMMERGIDFISAFLRMWHKKLWMKFPVSRIMK